MSEDLLKYKLIPLAENGAEAPEIAETLGVSITKASSMLKSYFDSVKAGTLQDFINMEDVLVQEAMTYALSQTPAGLSKEAKVAASNVLEAKSLLTNLQEQLATTASNINLRVRSLAIGATSAEELKVLADTVCALNNSFFNSKATQVNIQNNVSAGPKAYGDFLSDKPKDL